MRTDLKKTSAKMKVSVMIVVSVLILTLSVSAYIIRFDYGLASTPQYVTPYLYFASSTCDAIDGACSAWGGAVEIPLVYMSGDRHETETYPTSNGYNYITRGNRGANQYLMECYHYTNWWDSETIQEADIDINVFYSFSSNGSPYDYNVQNCMTHEIGHFIGLDDMYSGYASEYTMYYLIYTGELMKSTLELDDIYGAIALYGY